MAKLLRGCGIGSGLLSALKGIHNKIHHRGGLVTGGLVTGGKGKRRHKGKRRGSLKVRYRKKKR